jgi:hypothetical protein
MPLVLAPFLVVIETLSYIIRAIIIYSSSFSYNYGAPDDYNYEGVPTIITALLGFSFSGPNNYCSVLSWHDWQTKPKLMTIGICHNYWLHAFWRY